MFQEVLGAFLAFSGYSWGVPKDLRSVPGDPGGDFWGIQEGVQGRFKKIPSDFRGYKKLSEIFKGVSGALLKVSGEIKRASEALQVI